MTRPTSRTLLLAGSATLVAVTALLLVRSCGDDGADRPSAAGGDQAITVRTLVVRPETVGTVVTTVGTVLSNESVEIRPQVSGQIRSISFSEGTTVRKDDLLVKINDDELQAQLVRARARLALGQQLAERRRQLFDKNLVSEEEYTTAVNELDMARAEIQLIEAQIARTAILAPFDGTIGLRSVSEGSTVSPSTLITILQDNSRMKIDFTVAEKYAAEIRPGDRITFRVQARPDLFVGRVYSVDARIDEATRTLRVRALADNPRRLLLPGSFATIEVRLRPRAAVTVPTYALVPELKGHRVFLFRGGRAASRTVTVDARSDTTVEITSGLRAGDTLLVSALLQLREGMPVRLLPPPPGAGR